jgi:uncharacterized protein YjdB
VTEQGGSDGPAGRGLKGGDDSEITGKEENASFNQEIGGENDPGRLAEEKFQKINAQDPSDAGYTRDTGNGGENTYETLDSERAA